MTRARVGVMISGRGSTMESLARAAQDADAPASVTVVLCNEPDAPGIARARALGLTVEVLDHRAFADREAHEAALDARLRAHGVEWVALAGYLRRLTPRLIDGWGGRMVNIHPSLLPAFPGLHTHRRALAAGVRLHGCTVHGVTLALDSGPILAQAAVPVLPGDTERTLAARVLAQEHRLYPAALRLAVSGAPMAAPADAVLAHGFAWG